MFLQYNDLSQVFKYRLLQRCRYCSGTVPPLYIGLDTKVSDYFQLQDIASWFTTLDPGASDCIRKCTSQNSHQLTRSSGSGSGSGRGYTILQSRFIHVWIFVLFCHSANFMKSNRDTFSPCSWSPFVACFNSILISYVLGLNKNKFWLLRQRLIYITYIFTYSIAFMYQRTNFSLKTLCTMSSSWVESLGSFFVASTHYTTRWRHIYIDPSRILLVNFLQNYGPLM